MKDHEGLTKDRRTVSDNVNDHEMRKWAKRLGVSEHELHKPAAVVGASATGVRQPLRKR